MITISSLGDSARASPPTAKRCTEDIMLDHGIRKELAFICELFRQDSSPLTELATVRLERILDGLPTSSPSDVHNVGSSPLVSLIQETIRRDGDLRSFYGSSSEKVAALVALGEGLIAKYATIGATFSLADCRDAARVLTGNMNSKCNLTSPLKALKQAQLIEMVEAGKIGSGYRLT